MDSPGLETQLTTLLSEGNRQGGFPLSLLCTEQGLLLASAGDSERCEVAAVLTSLFDDIVTRALRDLPIQRVDELTLVGERGERYVIRPLPLARRSRLFLVVLTPRNTAWRRTTNQLVRDLARTIDPLVSAVDGEEEPDVV